MFYGSLIPLHMYMFISNDSCEGIKGIKKKSNIHLSGSSISKENIELLPLCYMSACTIQAAVSNQLQINNRYAKGFEEM